MAEHLSGAIWLVDTNGNKVTNANVSFTSVLQSIIPQAKLTVANPPQNGDYNKWVCHIDNASPGVNGSIYQGLFDTANYSVNAPGYKAAKGSINLVSANYAIVTVTLTPLPAAPGNFIPLNGPASSSFGLYGVNVILTDADTGQPLHNATVTLIYGSDKFTFHTDANGKAQVSVGVNGGPTIVASLTFQEDNYVSLTKSVVITQGAAGIKTLPVQLKPGGGSVTVNPQPSEDPGSTPSAPGSNPAGTNNNTLDTAAAPATDYTTWVYAIIFVIVLFALYTIFKNRQQPAAT